MIPAFSACTESPEPGMSTRSDGVGDPGHLDLALPRSHGLDEHDVLPRRVEQEHGLQRCLGEPAEVAARPHRADVDARIEEVVGEPDAVAEERAARERARRDRPRRRRRCGRARGCAHERADEARLPDTRRAGDADDRGAARSRDRLTDDAGTRAGRRPRRARSHVRAHAGRPPARRRRGSSSVSSLRATLGLYAQPYQPLAPRARPRAAPRSPRGASQSARVHLRARRPVIG